MREGAQEELRRAVANKTMEINELNLESILRLINGLNVLGLREGILAHCLYLIQRSNPSSKQLQRNLDHYLSALIILKKNKLEVTDQF